MQFIISFLVFVFGLIIGSFLNCVIYRLGSNKSFLKGRSFCPECKHVLAWNDLIPVISYLMLLGKCRYCKKAISIQYPLIELATAILFVSVFNFDHITRTVYLFIALSLFIVIFVFDLKHYIIPDKVVLPAIVISLVYNAFLLFTGDIVLGKFLNYIYAGFFPALFFFLLFFISQGKWIGFGDVKLALFMGLFLGFPKILVALFLAFMFGAIIGVGLIVFGNKTIKSELPFGPFLISGTILALFFGTNIINWYLSFLIL